ncbi:MAG: IS3 family transposase [Saprospiraceae bacterium]|nr:IS3 family transposase [Saprospiraceae bacterium]
MRDLHPRLPMERLCGLFDKSRQAFYQRQQVIYEQALEEHFILSEVIQIRKKQPRLGVRKLLVKLAERGIEMGRDALFDLLRNNGMLVKRRRKGTITTHSSHWLRKYPNLIRHFEALRPNRLWVSDITYIETSEGFLYLFLITDAYSKKILGWALADNLDAENAVEALQMALRSMKVDCSGLIHHSDRGVQYCSEKYVKLLNKHNIQISMTENGDPLENAIAERVNGILKDEWLYEVGRLDKVAMCKIIPQIIQLYNNERPHLSLNMLTPNVAHQMSERLKKRWKNYYKPAIPKEEDRHSACTN